MKSRLILFLTIVFTAISRFFLIDKIPPSLDPEIINLRIISAIGFFVSSILIFQLVKNYWQNTKVALLSSWVFSVLPWTLEQGRIYSQPNLAITLVLIVLFLIQKSKFKLRWGMLFFIPLILFFIYPQFWVFRLSQFKLNLNSLITNLFILTSPDFIFFKNITFWWGGIREFGIMFLSFAPFFATGIYRLIINPNKITVILLISILFVSALSPFFPESREFYFSTPLISLAIGSGIYNWQTYKNKFLRAIIVILFITTTYELSQFFHFYLIHYPQEIISNFSQIHEAF